MAAFVAVRDVPDGIRDDLNEAWILATGCFSHHDVPIVIAGIEEVAVADGVVLFVVLPESVVVLEAVVPLRLMDALRSIDFQDAVQIRNRGHADGVG